MAESQIAIEIYSRPSLTQQIKLNSEYTKRVYQRYFKSVVSALYMIDTILYIIGEKAHIELVQAAVSKLIESCSEDLANEIQRLERLREDNGIDIFPKYSNPGHYDIDIVSPQVSQFVALMMQMDNVIQLIDSLWLSNLLPNEKRADAEYQWQRRIQKLARRIISIRKNAYSEAQKRGISNEVEIAEQVLKEKGVEITTETEEVDEAEAETEDA
ncbi:MULTISPECIES: hypothetical protein [Methylomonas]|uniref:hypothetical protein n=1 Tax=Methylomonas TaxID=416 RepID=UPI000A9D5F72|nr:hypothetical protein [Methylomonas koyamae]